eukprot:TRINITY_DN5941_c0_g1_i1.p1 TRINITY_DN5941_c0_g1~~TRINITY_DN5941_c0_g1_i1.p1  ORF type:complete len:1411 (-),score=296.42 TRINITY_DN5941_c0_g1_i1:220-4452(-)
MSSFASGRSLRASKAMPSPKNFTDRHGIPHAKAMLPFPGSRSPSRGASKESHRSHGARSDGKTSDDERQPTKEEEREARKTIIRNGSKKSLASSSHSHRSASGHFSDEGKEPESVASVLLRANVRTTTYVMKFCKALGVALEDPFPDSDIVIVARQLCNAAAIGHYEKVRELVTVLGADPNMGDYDKRTALHVAAAAGHGEVVKELLRNPKTKVNAKDRWGVQPLEEAARGGFKPVMEMLSDKGAVIGRARMKRVPLSEFGDDEKETNEVLVNRAHALCTAAFDGNVEKLKWLIGIKNYDVDSKDHDRRTALHVAASEGKLECLEYLLTVQGININPEDQYRCTPLDDAEREGRSLAVRMLRTHGACAGRGPLSRVQVDHFGELLLSESQVAELSEMWENLIAFCGSRDALANLVYDTFSTAVPELKALFQTPRAVMTFSIFTGVNTLISNASNPARLKAAVETLAYRHLHLDVFAQTVETFRDCFVDMLVLELGSKLLPDAAAAMESLLEYAGAAFMFCKIHYQERMDILTDSWKLAKDTTLMAQAETGEIKRTRRKNNTLSMSSKEMQAAGECFEGDANVEPTQTDNAHDIPTSFREMFLFNAAVMGFGQNLWMAEVLDQFDNIMTNFTSVGRVQEECYVLTIRMVKVAAGKVDLAEFRSCMLASLRSLMPKVWTTAHEAAWSWAWGRIEALLLENMGKTQRWEKAFFTMLDQIDEAAGYQLRSDIYDRFFQCAPTGEMYFKQNVTYLHLLITKIIAICANMYREPVVTVDDISGVGLRHVGYGIPTELFTPFIDVMRDVFLDLGVDEISLQGFSWVINLVGMMMTRTITEGSTIVMKAVNINSAKAMRNAIACAGRGERAKWMLLITVGTRDISPFLWAVQSGSIDAARAMLEDLLAIRADRDRYYYEADYIFTRHPQLLQLLLQDAPVLVQPLFDGLIWRSRVTTDGYRRVNYYLKHLLVGEDGKFAPALDWVVKARDPKLIVHPVLVLLGDLLWYRIALWSFLRTKSWFLWNAMIFLGSQSIIKALHHEVASQYSVVLRVVTACLRGYLYFISLSHLLFWQAGNVRDAYRNNAVYRLGRVSIPAFILNFQEACSILLALALAVMMCTEPILWCMNSDEASEEVLTDVCESFSSGVPTVYNTASLVGIITFCMVVLELAVLNNRLSAYFLIIVRMIPELLLFLLAMLCTLLSLSSAFSCIQPKDDDFKSIPGGVVAMWEMFLRMVSSQEKYAQLHQDTLILLGVYTYLVLSVVFLANLLIAQMCCSYGAIYAEMDGYARLQRCHIIVTTMNGVSPRRWERFLANLKLDERLEFNEGDVGVAGGVQVQEAAFLHPTTREAITRVGGTTDPRAVWPQESDVDDDRFRKLENTVKKALDMLAQQMQKRQGVASGLSTHSGGSGHSGGSR